MRDKRAVQISLAGQVGSVDIPWDPESPCLEMVIGSTGDIHLSGLATGEQSG